MKTVSYHPLFHRFAVATMILALTPIIMGALVTTYNAGMAFRDWPSSDGYNLFFYPWLKSAGDKFIEHGHRLAGAMIGFVSILLAGLAWKLEKRKSVRIACYGVLVSVIIQGLLGGGRVRLDARTLALVHGSFAALVFALMTGVAIVTSRSWIAAEPRETPAASTGLSVLADVCCLSLFLQYLMGGFVRHLGTALYEHLAGAVFASLMVITTAVVARRSKIPRLQQIAKWMLGFLLLQVSLGLGTWVMKFGFASTGYVAVVNSLPQILFRTAHTVSGMFLLASAVVLKMHIYRQQSLTTSPVMNSHEPEAALTWQGGLQ